jgi:shikimate dehydrogenase
MIAGPQPLTTTRLGVLGWPVAHSRSPAMHNAALAELGLTGWRYQHLPVPPERFAETTRALSGAGFRGANVTIPHKEAALALATQASERAQAIGAANTLTFGEAGEIEADNTDAPGFIAALPEPPRPGSRALLLGAGGSARAVAWALREAGVEVLVWNRTPERAERLAAELAVHAVRRAEPADLLVNCTSVGLSDPSSTFKHLPVAVERVDTYATVADLVYRPAGTELLTIASREGCAVVDGLEILVRQGALSLEAWTGLQAPVQVMRAAAGRGDSRIPRDPTRPPASRAAPRAADRRRAGP